MNLFVFNRQFLRPSFKEILNLPVKAASTDTGRIKTIILKKMRVYLTHLTIDPGSTDSTATFNFQIFNSSQGQIFDLCDVTLPATPSVIYDTLRTRIVSLVLSNWSVTISPDDIIFEYPGLAPIPTTVLSFSNPTLAVNTSRQASATRNAQVSVSVDITAGLSLSGGTTGKVELKYADDSAFTTNVKSVQPASNGNTGTLTIGLALNQLVTATIIGIVPAAKYYRIVTTNVAGTPTYGTPAIQEVLL